jgi:hypothetical protein
VRLQGGGAAAEPRSFGLSMLFTRSGTFWLELALLAVVLRVAPTGAHRSSVLRALQRLKFNLAGLNEPIHLSEYQLSQLASRRTRCTVSRHLLIDGYRVQMYFECAALTACRHRHSATGSTGRHIDLLWAMQALLLVRVSPQHMPEVQFLSCFWCRPTPRAVHSSCPSARRRIPAPKPPVSPVTAGYPCRTFNLVLACALLLNAQLRIHRSLQY